MVAFAETATEMVEVGGAKGKSDGSKRNSMSASDIFSMETDLGFSGLGGLSSLIPNRGARHDPLRLLLDPGS